MFFGKLFRQKTSIPNFTKSLLPASAVFALAVIVSLCLPGCGRKPTPTTTETTEDTRPTESIAQVGDIPDAFQEIIEEDRFRHVEAFTDRLMEVTTTSSEDGKTITHTVTMMDLYGEIIASYTLETNDAYGVTSVTPTSDGGFIFAVGFNGSYIPGRDQIETGYHSRIIKCDDDGQVLFGDRNSRRRARSSRRPLIRRSSHISSRKSAREHLPSRRLLRRRWSRSRADMRFWS